jgi:WD40 repeat protein
MVYGPDGNLYVSSYNNDIVTRYNGTTGAYMDVFVTSGFVLRQPTGLTFGPDGNLYVSSFNGARVLRYNGATGTYINTFIAPGSGGLSGPMGLVFGPDSNLYVSSYNNDRVIRYNGTTGALIGSFTLGLLPRPTGLVFGPDGHLYVSSYNESNIRRFNGTTGAYMGIFNSGGPSSGRPTGLIFGPDGNSDGNDDLYVSSEINDQILRYDGTTGIYIDQFVSSGSGGLDAPWGLVFKTGGPPQPPDNDDCNQPIVVSELPYSLSGLDVSDATTSVDDPCLWCGDSEFPQQSHSVWFTYTPPTNEWINVSTFGSNYSTVLAVFTGECGGNLTELACVPSVINNLPVDGGVPLLIEVTSHGQQPANNLDLTLNNPSIPVHNITQNTYHSTIQSAINAAGLYDEIVV